MEYVYINRTDDFGRLNLMSLPFSTITWNRIVHASTSTPTPLVTSRVIVGLVYLQPTDRDTHHTNQINLFTIINLSGNSEQVDLVYKPHVIIIHYHHSFHHQDRRRRLRHPNKPPSVPHLHSSRGGHDRRRCRLCGQYRTFLRRYHKNCNPHLIIPVRVTVTLSSSFSSSPSECVVPSRLRGVNRSSPLWRASGPADGAWS